MQLNGVMTFESSININNIDFYTDNLFKRFEEDKFYTDLLNIVIERNNKCTLQLSFEYETDIDVDLSRCESSSAYFSSNNECWYPGEYNWDPRFTFDKDGICNDLLCIIKSYDSNVNSIKVVYTRVIGESNGIEIDEKINSNVHLKSA